MNINILRDFSEYPKLRYCNLSENSAEEFYHNILNEKFAQAYAKKEILEVNIDQTAGYTSSFLDEAFGNLIFDFSKEVVNRYLKIISTDEPFWLDMIYKETFVEWEKRRKDNTPPIKTQAHNPWYRLIENKLIKKNWIDAK